MSRCPTSATAVGSSGPVRTTTPFPMRSTRTPAKRPRTRLDEVRERRLLAGDARHRDELERQLGEPVGIEAGHTETPKSRSASFSEVLRSVDSERWPMISAHGMP